MFYSFPRDRYTRAYICCAVLYYTLIRYRLLRSPRIVIAPTITLATNYLKNVCSSSRLLASPSHPPRSLFLSFLPFFSEFSRKVFSYKTKWHLFGIGRKNTVLNPFLPFPFLSPPSPFRSLNNRNPSSPLAPVHAKYQQVPSSFTVLKKKKIRRPRSRNAIYAAASTAVKFPIVTLLIITFNTILASSRVRIPSSRVSSKGT